MVLEVEDLALGLVDLLALIAIDRRALEVWQRSDHGVLTDAIDRRLHGTLDTHRDARVEEQADDVEGQPELT